MAPRQHRPCPHLAYPGADVAETRCGASELHAKEYPHPYPEYLIWHLHGPKAKRERERHLILLKYPHPQEITTYLKQ